MKPWVLEKKIIYIYIYIYIPQPIYIFPKPVIIGSQYTQKKNPPIIVPKFK